MPDLRKTTIEDPSRISETRFRLLSETVSLLLQSEDPKAIGDILPRTVVEHVHCDLFINYLIDTDSGKLHLNACSGIPEETARKIEWLDLGELICGTVAATGRRTVWQDTPQTSDPGAEFLRLQGIRAYVCHPLIARGNVIGTLSFGKKREDRFSEADLDFLQTIADEVAIAVARSQSLKELHESNAMLEYRVAERTRELESAYRQLAENELRFRIALTDSRTMLFQQDRDLRYTWVYNPTPGFSEEMILGKTDWDLFPPEEAEPLVDLKMRAMESGVMVRGEVGCNLAGQMRYYDLSIYPQRDPEGRPTGIACAGIDMTESRQKEIRLRELAAEVTQAEERERERIAHLLHENLQQVLVVAKYSAGSLLNRVSERALKEQASTISDLISNSIEISRSLAVELMPPVLNDSTLATGLRWLSRWMKRQHGLTVEVTAKDIYPRIPRDVKVMLFRAVQELLLNVVKHAKADRAQLVLRHDPKIGEIRLEVIDGGAGMNQEVLRAEPSGLRGGFGLFSIRERVRHLGGHMEIESAPAHGTRIRITVPHLSKPVFSSTSEKKQYMVARTAVGRHGPIRIVVADDHTVVRKGLVEVLGKEPDLSVVGEASDGQEAVQLVRQVHPSVVLMDVSMPKMSGVEATEIIRAESPNVRVIALSMYDQGEMSSQMQSAGAARYIIKTGPIEELVTAIREVTA